MAASRRGDHEALTGLARRNLESSAPVASGYIAEYDLSGMALTDAVSGKEALQRRSALDPMREDMGARWVIYIDPARICLN